MSNDVNQHNTFQIYLIFMIGGFQLELSVNSQLYAQLYSTIWFVLVYLIGGGRGLHQ